MRTYVRTYVRGSNKRNTIVTHTLLILQCYIKPKNRFLFVDRHFPARYTDLVHSTYSNQYSDYRAVKTGWETAENTVRNCRKLNEKLQKIVWETADNTVKKCRKLNDKLQKKWVRNYKTTVRNWITWLSNCWKHKEKLKKTAKNTSETLLYFTTDQIFIC